MAMHSCQPRGRPTQVDRSRALPLNGWNSPRTPSPRHSGIPSRAPSPSPSGGVAGAQKLDAGPGAHPIIAAEGTQPHGTSLRSRQRSLCPDSWHHHCPPNLPLLVLLLLALSLFPSCSSAPAAPPPPAETNPNLIQWFYGSPQVSSFVGEGDTLTWLWFDAKPHSLEGDDDASKKIFSGGPGFGENVVSQVNFTLNVTFTKKGTYTYKCHQHPFVMLGTVNVKPKFNFGGVELRWFLGISYGGASAIVYEGDTVSWRWADDLPHALTALNGDQTQFTGPGSNNNTVSGEETFVFKKKFVKAGVYLYKCQNHGSQMRGNITVLPKPGKPQAPSGPPAPATPTSPTAPSAPSKSTPTAPSRPAPKGKASSPPWAKGKGGKKPPPPSPPPPKKAPAKKGKGKGKGKR